MDAEALTLALGGRWHGHYGLASCPVPGHGRGLGDRHPSLSIARGDRQAIIIHCHGGCSPAAVLAQLSDLGLWRPAAGLPAAPAPRRPVPGPDPRPEAARRLWQRAVALSGTPAASYLARRKIPADSEALRYLPSDRWPDLPATADGALIAALRSRTGEIRAVQLTYLTEAGDKARADPVRQTFGPMAGTAVQLRPAGDCLGLAEGIETALSASVLFGHPVWAVCGRRLKDAPVPPGTRKVLLYADNDRPGREAAARAQDFLLSRGLTVEVWRPEGDGLDWNDVLVLQKGKWS